ncbi:unnamed protein product [Closterium sp. Yama58-4]|nr:unnamed protein product [Closterium sp. Yama58-4]
MKVAFSMSCWRFMWPDESLIRSVPTALLTMRHSQQGQTRAAVGVLVLDARSATATSAGGARSSATTHGGGEPEAPLVGYGSRARLPTGNRSRTISLQELMEHFHLPINEAACKLGVCVTVLKQQCREHGIQRWPFRKVRKLDNMLHALENSTPPERLRPFALTNGEEERKRKIDTVKGALCQLLVDPNSAAHLKIGKLKGTRVKDVGTRDCTSAVSPSSSREMSPSQAKSVRNEAEVLAKPIAFYGFENSSEEIVHESVIDQGPRSGSGAIPAEMMYAASHASSGPPRRPLPVPSSSPSPSGSAASAGDGRFVPNPFQYNARVASALVPCVLVLLGAGGPLVVGTLVAGLMLSYVLDALQLKTAAFVAIWTAFFSTAAAIAFSGVGFAPHVPVPLSLLVLLSAVNLVFLCGVWVSLQFRWLHLEHPFVVLTLERLLFACTPLTAVAIITWGLVASVGIVYAPFYLVPVLFALFWLFSLPAPSSFRAAKHHPRLRGKESDDVFILGSLESAIHAGVLLFLPLGFHVAVHRNRWMESAGDICDDLLLFFLPVLFLLAASTRGALHWLVRDHSKLQHVRSTWMTHTNAFCSPHHSPLPATLPAPPPVAPPPPLPAPPPPPSCSLSYSPSCSRSFPLLSPRLPSTPPHQVRVVNGAFALAVVLVCGEVRVIFPSFAHYIHFPPPLSYLLVTLALFGLAFGFAAHLLGLVTGLVGTSVLMAVLLVSAVAGSLVLGMPLTMLPAPAIAAVYLAHFHSTHSLTSYLIFAAAAAIAATWFVLDHFFFLALSVAGVPLRSICQGMLGALLLALLVPAATLLHRPQRVTGVLVVLQALLFACLPCLLPPPARLESLLYNGDGRAEEGVYPSFLVVTTTVAGLAAVQRLHAEHKIGAVAEWVGSCVYLAKLPMLAVSSPGATFSSLLLLAVTPPFFLYRDKAHARSRMRPGVAVVHAAAAVAAVVHARFMLFDIAVSLTGHRPSHALLIGALLLAAITACLPILLLHFPNSMSARRTAALAAAGAALFMCLQPPLPPAWRTLWDSAHFPEEDDPDDSTIYALPTHGPLWPAWLLLSLILSGLAAFLRAIPIGEVEAVRVGYALGMGVATGVYLQAEFFLFLPLLPRVLLFLAAIAGALFLVLAHRPPSWISPHSPLLPGLFAVQAALLPLTYLAVGRAALVEVQGEGEAGKEYDLYDDTRRKTSPFTPKHRTFQRHMGLLATFTSRASWMPLVGNAATLASFLLALSLLTTLAQHDSDQRAIFLIAPILLLLNPHLSFPSAFSHRRRYFPLTLACSAYLILSVLVTVTAEAATAVYYWGWSWVTLGYNVTQLAWTVGMVLLCVPMHVLFNLFIWDNVRRSEYLLLLLAPMCVPAVVLPGETPVVRVVGVLGLIYAFLQLLISRHIRVAGLRLI